MCLANHNWYFFQVVHNCMFYWLLSFSYLNGSKVKLGLKLTMFNYIKVIHKIATKISFHYFLFITSRLTSSGKTKIHKISSRLIATLSFIKTNKISCLHKG